MLFVNRRPPTRPADKEPEPETEPEPEPEPEREPEPEPEPEPELAEEEVDTEDIRNKVVKLEEDIQHVRSNKTSTAREAQLRLVSGITDFSNASSYYQKACFLSDGR